MSGAGGITQAGATVAPGRAITASMPGMDTSTAIPGTTVLPPSRTRVGTGIIAIDERGGLSPLVAAKTAPHPRLSEL